MLTQIIPRTLSIFACLNKIRCSHCLCTPNKASALDRIHTTFRRYVGNHDFIALLAVLHLHSVVLAA